MAKPRGKHVQDQQGYDDQDDFHAPSVSLHEIFVQR